MASTPYPLPRETRESAVLAGNGTVGPYGPSLYKIFDTADVKVFAKALGETVFTDVTDAVTIAKVTPTAAYDYFTVTFDALVPATTAWYHQARRVAERSVAVTRGGTLDSNQLEKELSKQATVESEVRRDLDRAVMVEVGTDPIKVLPGVDGELVKFDADGNMVTSGENVDTIEGSTAAAVAAAATATTKAAEAAVSAGVLASLVAGFAAFWFVVLQTASAAAAWLALQVLGHLSSRTLLKALTPAAGMAVFLSEAGREGTFVWRTGDFTALIAADNQEGVYIKATAVAASVGAWVRADLKQLKPQMFGAAVYPADATTALLGMMSLNAVLQLPIYLDGLFKSTAPLAVTGSLIIEGVGAGRCGFLFANSHGIKQTTAADSATILRFFSILTDQAMTKVGFEYVGGTVSDWTNSRIVEEVLSCGYSYWANGSAATQEWLKDFLLTDADLLRFQRVVAQGSTANITADYSTDTRGFDVSGTTHLVLEDCHAHSKNYGVKVSGQSENSEIVRGSYLNNNFGVDLTGMTAPCNDHNAHGVHLVARRCALNYSNATTDLAFTTIRDCLTFSDGTGVAGYRHIKVGGIAPMVAGNYCHRASADDAVASAHIGVEVLNNAQGALILQNTFYLQGNCITNTAGCTGTAVGGNTTIDNAGSEAVAPMSDLGTGTRHQPNFGAGTRVGLWSIAGSDPVIQKAGRGTILAFSSSVAFGASTNNLSVFNQAAGLSPGIQAEGADANIDVRLIPKGTGAVKISGGALPPANDSGALGSAALSWADLFLASGGVINFANGNYTITHTSGVLTFSGAVVATHFDVGANQVVGARSTGWTAGTGTANKAAFATYAGATMSAGYVQAEAQATNDAARNATQRIKAIEDALRTHGLIN
ncbi:MAG: hypothetical protein EOR94_22650 [Mesorhizobium sp.]|nr:MAG: hypothetical protein EOR94_22650 [Mesorhizobium sp.]